VSAKLRLSAIYTAHKSRSHLPAMPPFRPIGDEESEHISQTCVKPPPESPSQWTAALVFDDSLGGEGMQCVAALITSRHLLVSRRCFFGQLQTRNPKEETMPNVLVLLGTKVWKGKLRLVSSSTRPGGQTRRAAKIFGKIFKSFHSFKDQTLAVP